MNPVESGRPAVRQSLARDVAGALRALTTPRSGYRQSGSPAAIVPDSRCIHCKHLEPRQVRPPTGEGPPCRTSFPVGRTRGAPVCSCGHARTRIRQIRYRCPQRPSRASESSRERPLQGTQERHSGAHGAHMAHRPGVRRCHHGVYKDERLTTRQPRTLRGLG